MGIEVLQRPIDLESRVSLEIALGYFIDKKSHPFTNELAPCLTVYIPNLHSVRMLTNNSSPSHYTPKNVQIESFNTDATVHIDSSTIKYDDNEGFPRRVLRELSSANTLMFLFKGCCLVKLNDANPPCSVMGKRNSGKVYDFLVDGGKVALTAKKDQWISEAITSKKTKSVKCEGTVFEIFGDQIDSIIDPSTLPREILQESKMKACGIWEKSIQLRVEKAMRAAEKYKKG